MTLLKRIGFLIRTYPLSIVVQFSLRIGQIVAEMMISMFGKGKIAAKMLT
jgi:hypothetical protein